MSANRKHCMTWALIALAQLVIGASPSLAQSLGTAGEFAVLAGSTVTNTGATVVSGELGVSPGTAVTGFPPGSVVLGTIHLNDAVAAQAQSDLTTAYDAIAGTPCTVDLTGQDLGGLTLIPGVYCFSSTAFLTGALTLDAQGNPNALFLFKIGAALTTATGSSVQVINGGSNCSVFWQVGSSATLGTATRFVGNVLALTSITLTTGASVDGRVLARNGAVTLDTGTVTVCPTVGPCPLINLDPAVLPNGETAAAYNAVISATGGISPYTFSISNGALPDGLALDTATGIISGMPVQAGTFNFTVTAIDANGCPGSRAYRIIITGPNCPVIILSPATLPAGTIGTSYSQSVSASGGIGPYSYIVSAGALPNGLALSTPSGVISGIPITSGQFIFTITATDANSCPGSRPYSIVIPVSTGCPTIVVAPATLPATTIGIPYSQVVSASGGVAPYAFAVSGGSLPPGLALASASGVISGTPTTPGAFSFTITATDANGCAGSRTYTVQPASVSPVAAPTLSHWSLLLLSLVLTATAALAFMAEVSARKP